MHSAVDEGLTFFDNASDYRDGGLRIIGCNCGDVKLDGVYFPQSRNDP